MTADKSIFFFNFTKNDSLEFVKKNIAQHYQIPVDMLFWIPYLENLETLELISRKLTVKYTNDENAETKGLLFLKNYDNVLHISLSNLMNNNEDNNTAILKKQLLWKYLETQEGSQLTSSTQNFSMLLSVEPTPKSTFLLEKGMLPLAPIFLVIGNARSMKEYLIKFGKKQALTPYKLKKFSYDNDPWMDFVRIDKLCSGKNRHKEIRQWSKMKGTESYLFIGFRKAVGYLMINPEHGWVGPVGALMNELPEIMSFVFNEFLKAHVDKIGFLLPSFSTLSLQNLVQCGFHVERLYHLLSVNIMGKLDSYIPRDFLFF